MQTKRTRRNRHCEHAEHYGRTIQKFSDMIEKFKEPMPYVCGLTTQKTNFNTHGHVLETRHPHILMSTASVPKEPPQRD